MDLNIVGLGLVWMSCKHEYIYVHLSARSWCVLFSKLSGELLARDVEKRNAILKYPDLYDDDDGGDVYIYFI